jgi:hypothetical protein
VFESGALLLYLARIDTYGGGKLLGGPTALAKRHAWNGSSLFFQADAWELHHS